MFFKISTSEKYSAFLDKKKTDFKNIGVQFKCSIWRKSKISGKIHVLTKISEYVEKWYFWL